MKGKECDRWMRSRKWAGAGTGMGVWVVLQNPVYSKDIENPLDDLWQGELRCELNPMEKDCTTSKQCR